MLSAALLAAESTEAVNHLPVAPIWYGVGAFAALVVLLAVTYAYRSVGTRH